MNRRGFFASLAALAATAALPAVPSIPVMSSQTLIKLMCSSMYGKFNGGRVVYMDTDGVITYDIASAYPETLPRS